MTCPASSRAKYEKSHISPGFLSILHFKPLANTILQFDCPPVTCQTSLQLRIPRDHCASNPGHLSSSVNLPPAPANFILHNSLEISTTR